jgi:hypothetical protein
MRFSAQRKGVVLAALKKRSKAFLARNGKKALHVSSIGLTRSVVWHERQLAMLLHRHGRRGLCCDCRQEVPQGGAPMSQDMLTMRLHNRAQVWHDMQIVLYPFLRTILQGGGSWELVVRRIQRTKAQNRRYWGNGVLAQIAEQVVVNGRKYAPESWHEQFKRQFIGFDELPNGQIIGKSSAKLSTKEFCEFCDQVEAYAATELGVTFYDFQAHPRDVEARKPARAREEVAA